MNQCDFLYKVKKTYVNIMLTIPATCDHVITQNVNNNLLNFNVHLSSHTLSYHLQMAKNIFKYL